MAERRARLLDTVELLRDVDGWRAGTRGAVVSEYSHSVLVEVLSGDEDRDLLDALVSVPHDAVRVVEPAAAPAR